MEQQMLKDLAERIFSFMLLEYSSSPSQADLAFVFGRNDLSLAKEAYVLWYQGPVSQILITGGVGKDSGELPIAEADFLAAHIYTLGVPGDMIHVERKACNGAENSRFGLAMVQDKGIPCQRVILVGHATNLLRLYAVHTFLARECGMGEVVYELRAPPYDLKEEDYPVVLAEFKRLIEWPRKGWADQLVLPPDLVQAVLEAS